MTEELTRDLSRLVQDSPDERDPSYAEFVWLAGKRRRTRARALSAAATVAAAMGVVAVVMSLSPRNSNGPLVPATSAPAATTGTLKGNVPLCYGPASDMNLTPTLVVIAQQNGQTKGTVTVPATLATHTYQLTLPSGTYTIRAGSWPARQVIVRAGETSSADLPGGNCL
ncbi:hypothetical protein [Terrabacter sp. 2RAF25]|uniref:hypothetical protein n=1 Tax=Terrabacter sp. 2RAF25 TaxID=3232998 RepID=UPI003F9E4D93